MRTTNHERSQQQLTLLVLYVYSSMACDEVLVISVAPSRIVRRRKFT